MQNSGIAELCSQVKIRKAVIPSSTEHNEGLSLLIDQQFLGLFYLIQLLVFIINCQIVNAPY